MLALALWGGLCAVVRNLLGSKLIALSMFCIGASLACVILGGVHVWRGRNRAGGVWRWIGLLLPLLWLGRFLFLLIDAWQSGYVFFAE